MFADSYDKSGGIAVKTARVQATSINCRAGFC
jgi:hypothetical protein